ncbi:MAG: hypothetical protein ACD_79C01469G0006 [uncultured bacterium]|nr:MAG: hypothetical protein ACD_79C01469G0006 [uncultured bacterium]
MFSKFTNNGVFVQPLLIKLNKNKKTFMVEIDKRKFKRISSSSILSFRPIDKNNLDKVHQNYIPADVLNLSLKGILFESNYPLEEGCHIKLRLRLFNIISEDPSIASQNQEIEDLAATAKILRNDKQNDGTFLLAAELISIQEGNIELLTKLINSLT